MDCIRLTGIDVYAYHGAHPAERELGQRFVIDVELWTDVQGAAISDSMQDALDYTLVHQRIIELTAGESFQLLEALAGRICDMLLTEFALDAAASVIHVKSAARLGIRDFGVNRERVERLRLVLQPPRPA